MVETVINGNYFIQGKLRFLLLKKPDVICHKILIYKFCGYPLLCKKYYEYYNVKIINKYALNLKYNKVFETVTSNGNWIGVPKSVMKSTR